MFVTCQAELLARLRHRPRVLGDRSHVPAKGIMLGGTHGNTDCANRQLVPANPTHEGVAFGIRPSPKFGQFVLIDHELRRAAGANNGEAAVPPCLAPFADETEHPAPLRPAAEVGNDLTHRRREDLLAGRHDRLRDPGEVAHGRNSHLESTHDSLSDLTLCQGKDVLRTNYDG